MQRSINTLVSAAVLLGLAVVVPPTSAIAQTPEVVCPAQCVAALAGFAAAHPGSMNFQLTLDICFDATRGILIAGHNANNPNPNQVDHLEVFYYGSTPPGGLCQVGGFDLSPAAPGEYGFLAEMSISQAEVEAATARCVGL